jgi:aryl-alcohol dehydrogenase-like predicted oxidoreductase
LAVADPGNRAIFGHANEWSLMDTVMLGISGLEVSPIAFGTWQLSGDWGKFDEDEAIAAIRFARERGINFFDTAQAYGFGASERLLGKALRDDLDHRREEVVIATKGGLRLDEKRGLIRDSSPEWLRTGVEASLRALGVEYIDLYQIHWPDPEVSFATAARTLQALVDDGKIRHVGVSNFDAGQMAELARTRPVETAQPPYSLLNREVEAAVLPYCAEHHIGVLAYGPLAHGLLTGAMSPDTSFAEDDWRRVSPSLAGDTFRRNLEIVERLEQFARQRGYHVSQLAIAWTLANPAVNVAIVGSRRREHIERSLGALEIELSDRDKGEIERIIADAAAIDEATPETMTELMGLV